MSYFFIVSILAPLARPAILPVPQGGPEEAGPAEEMHVEGDVDADLMGALAAEGVPWLPSRWVA